MANYIISYDLNGQRPTHAEMDKHIEKLGTCAYRILETVWYVNSTKTRQDMATYVSAILSNNDSYIVVDATDMSFRKLLVSDQKLIDCWAK
ncbi:hypothetical protein AGR4A_Cc190039 [Agrobacterium tumefaciens str. B6]|uniref:SinR-like protein n=1 Tax=Agrobacterium tumefaciens str. B6 TaxID=1183423 RepID=A0A822UYW7_AGRTU|nr:hypothetical protein ASB65_18395 [Agrobacterium tumefaciens str. B6]MQB28199.1 hypothetical protein [Agrobacterium tumefaciens]OCJ38368.1 hypothetical protein A6U90_22560 [Agrobacterium tumefaciens]CVI15246.1 hypothetical protein AGR4A_Cc190039 [Agrobacterium tumefaciens str. B6]SPZ35440.1 Uncharacterised protein [Agrobacterium tumefaciens]